MRKFEKDAQEKIGAKVLVNIIIVFAVITGFVLYLKYI